MKALLVKLDKTLDVPRMVASTFAAPLLDVSFRLYLGWEFFKSGLGRAKDYLNGSWDTQIFLFELEHPVPGIDPQIAAPMATLGELILPVLLISGLFSRFAAAGLFVMALIIEMTYQHNFQHLLWMTLAASIFIRGPSPLSLDYLLVSWLRKDPKAS